ncbi:MAG: efflux RND transporter periplasmic adaptor subunit, partial [Planctomycetaceae bacterium]
EPVNVEVEVIQTTQQVDDFDLPGVVEANSVVKVAAEVDGRVEYIYDGHAPAVPTQPTSIATTQPQTAAASVPASAAASTPASAPASAPGKLEGVVVDKGQLIVLLNRELLEADYIRAKAQADLDVRDFERISQLIEKKIAAQQELDQARTKKDVSLATLKTAQARLDRATIIAPIRGVLNRLPVSTGEYVAPGTCVAQIVDTETVKVAVNVPERDVPWLKKGQSLTIAYGGGDDSPSAQTGETRLTGNISYISELADEASRTSRVEVTVDNSKHILRSGQIVRVTIPRQVLENVIMIPLRAVIPLENGKEVYVVRDGKAKSCKVVLGFFKGDRVQIVGDAKGQTGLKKDDLLIIPGNRYVSEGQPVKIQPSSTTQPTSAAT